MSSHRGGPFGEHPDQIDEAPDEDDEYEQAYGQRGPATEDRSETEALEAAPGEQYKY